MKLDPRTKLCFIILLTTLAVLAKDVAYLSIVVGVAVIVDLCLHVDIINTVLRLKNFIWLLLFIALVQSLSVKGGTVLIHIGSVNLLTTVGIKFALEFILRMSVILFAGLIATTTDGREMTDGLVLMHMPYELAFMASIALRFLPVFREEFGARMNAISMRGIDVKHVSLARKLKIYAYLIAPTISGSIIRSSELSRSITSRGFRAKKKRTMYRKLKMTALDWALTAFSVGSAAAYLVCMYVFGELVVW